MTDLMKNLAIVAMWLRFNEMPSSAEAVEMAIVELGNIEALKQRATPHTLH